MLTSSHKLAIYMEDSLHSDFGKMGYGVMRYNGAQITCIIDSVHAGKNINEVTSHAYPFPIVGSVEEAAARGADVMLLGIAPSGGRIPDSWYAPMETALSKGMSIINGLHDLLAERLAAQLINPETQWIWDVRKPAFTPDIASARAATLTNKRVLMIGTDMAIGKMTAGLELYHWTQQQPIKSAFVATGQIGITVTGRGIPLDAYKVDLACGAVEHVVMEAADNDIIFIEGQGSLAHPASTATLPLMRGSCVNRMILCHRTGVDHLRTSQDLKLPPLPEFIKLNEDVSSACGGLPRAKVVGIAVDTSREDEQSAIQSLKDIEALTSLPTDDVVRFGAGKLGQALLDS